ncbi:MAG: amidohydrolase family protein [Bryobacteraceae bacterium]
MSQTILLRGAKQLLTLRGPNSARRGAALQDLGIIEDGSVLIRDGVIVSVGSTRRIENLKAARDALEIPVEGRIITPGFVDASLHLSLHRSETSSQPKRIADFYDDSQTLMRSCLQHGTITADVKGSADNRDFHSDIAVLRSLVKIGSTPVRMVRTWRIGSGVNRTMPSDLRSTLETLLQRNFIHGISLAPRDPGDFDIDTVVASQAAGLPVKMLWSGHSKDVFAELLHQLNPHSVYAHSFDFLAPEALGNSPAIAVLAAGKQLFEGPVSTVGRNLVDAGAAIALSSGYQSTAAGNFSMQMSLALAVARLGLTPEEAWGAATINAAYAVGCGDITGSLEVGKQADLLILNVTDYREVPRQFGINHVAMVFRDGAIVLNRTRWRAPVEQPARRVRP